MNRITVGDATHPRAVTEGMRVILTRKGRA